jgi:hypothetical protein
MNRDLCKFLAGAGQREWLTCTACMPRAELKANAEIYAAPQALPSAGNSSYGPFMGYHHGRS